MAHSQFRQSPSASGRRAIFEMIDLQRRIFENQRRIIESNESHASSGFITYRNNYLKAVSGFLSISGFGALCDAIAASRVAFVADYHTLRLAQRTFVKLIHGIMQQVDHIALAMEFVHRDHQADLDRFSKGKISEHTFLKRIRYHDHWPYDIWPGFKPIFDVALDHGFPMVAIDSDADFSLTKRDNLAAQAIAAAARRFPDATILVYCGQMHIAPTHLPAAVDKAFIKAGMSAPDRVIVYQNAEEIYWQLASEGQEGIEVVKVDQESYCVNNTPPLVQQLSYLQWIRFDEELLEYTELDSTVRSIIRHLGRFIGIPFNEAAKSVRVLMPGDLDLVKTLDEGSLDDAEKQQVIEGVASEQSACIPALNAVYLATLSLNHASEEAAHYLKQSVANSRMPDDLKDRFYFYILNEACGFFGSKVINPKRKTDHQGKLRQIVAHARKRNGRATHYESAAKIALDHIAFECGNKNFSASSLKMLAHPAVFNAAVHILGYILGDRLYYGLTSGTVTKKTIRTLFLSSMEGPNEASNVYFELSSKVRGTKIPRRI